MKSSSRRSSFFSTWRRGSKPFTSPAIFVASPAGSNCVMGPMPERPAQRAAQVSSTVLPTGFTVPMPVMTTRLSTGSSTQGT